MKRILVLITLLFMLVTVALPATESTANDAKAKPAQGEKDKPAQVEKAKPEQEKIYWLTIKSGIRHNSKCRYYHNSKGQPCTKDEGRACKICGG